MLLVLGLIAVVPSPNDWVWLLGVLVTEGGHWALVACLPLFAPGWRRTRLSRAGVGLGLLGTLLLLTPLARAVAFSRELPGALETRFADLAAAYDAREIKALEGERQQEVTNYTMVIYLSFLIYLMIILVLANTFVPAIVDSSVATGGSTMSIGNLQVRELNQVWISTVFF